MLRIFLSLLTLFLGSLFTTTVFAGGGLVEWLPISSSNEDYNTYKISSLNSGEQFVISPRVHAVNDDPYDTTPRFCTDCPITIKLENPHPDDLINQSSDKTDEKGQMYAKIISNMPGKRYAYAEVTLPESEFTRKEGTRIYRSSYLVLNYSGQTQWEPSYNTIPGVSEPQPVTVIEEFPTINETPSLVPSENQDEVKRLNIKVEDLEKKLEASDKRQTFLEEKLNQILTWLKTIFPFFR